MATVAMETISIRNDKIFYSSLSTEMVKKKIIGIVFRTNGSKLSKWLPSQWKDSFKIFNFSC